MDISSGPVVAAGTHTVDVLVENGGRINYGAHLPDSRAGLVDPVLLDGKPLTGWQTFALPMDDPSKLTGWTTAKIDGPAFHRGTRQDRHAHRHLPGHAGLRQRLRLGQRP